jgi:hypothetical protein
MADDVVGILDATYNWAAMRRVRELAMTAYALAAGSLNDTTRRMRGTGRQVIFERIPSYIPADFLRLELLGPYMCSRLSYQILRLRFTAYGNKILTTVNL